MKNLKTLLKTSLPNRTINVNGEEVRIPRIGLKHINFMKKIDPTDVTIVKKYAHLFLPGCLWAEGEYVLFHVEAFNKNFKEEIEYKGDIFNINDIKITRKTEFEYLGNVYKFRKLDFFEAFATDANLLEETLESVNGDESIVVDWLSMPAFVSSWAHMILNTVSIRGKYGTVYHGADNIIGIFSNDNEE